jgi:triacylglycerol lipase
VPASRHIRTTHFFDLATALHLASAAELIYADPGIVERTAIGAWDYAHFRFIDVDTSQCFVAADAQTILVCFRGTEGNCVEDWIANVGLDLIGGPLEGRVHKGFYDALSCIWHLLDREIERLQSTGKRKLWVTGHSLGAALASLAVARWCEAGRPVAGLYTFGQPRTGDQTFARNFDFLFRPHVFRIVNDRDVVTRVPPRVLGYQHLGTFIYFTDSGSLSDDIDWWRRFLNGWHGTVEKVLDWGREGVEDHRMFHYRQKLLDALRDHGGGGNDGGEELQDAPRAAPIAEPIKPRRRAA